VIRSAEVKARGSDRDHMRSRSTSNVEDILAFASLTRLRSPSALDFMLEATSPVPAQDKQVQMQQYHSPPLNPSAHPMMDIDEEEEEEAFDEHS
jgi:hypothetical protein